MANLDEYKDRFWSKVDIRDIDNCWMWKGRLFRDRHGTLSYGAFDIRDKTFLSHKVAWIMSNGDISDKLQVLHKCDNKACVNPHHLYLGDRFDNRRDMEQRTPWKVTGGNLMRSRFSSSDVEQIKKMSKDGISQRKIARIFSCSRSIIYLLLKDKITRLSDMEITSE